MIIDVHTHVLPTMPTPSPAEQAAGWPRVVETDGVRQVFQGETLLRSVTSVAWDATDRITLMDREDVRVQVVMPAPFTFLYNSDPEVATAFAVRQNEAIADLCAAEPARLIGFCSVPLQDPHAASIELRRAVLELGLRGAEIGTNAGVRQLHDPELDQFFAVAEALDVPIFVHPGPLGSPERTAHSGLAFALARPVETELAVGSLVHGGVLERHPTLRMCLAHGGAGIPALTGRWHTGWTRRTPGIRADSQGPRTLLRRLWADTLTYDPYSLPLVERAFGADHLVIGTDFPFAARELPPGDAAWAAARDRLFTDPGLDAARLTENTWSFLGQPTSTSTGEPQ